MQKGSYVLNSDCRFVVGTTCIWLPFDSIVEVTQLDIGAEKVMVNFGQGLMDWMSWSDFKKLFYPVPVV